MIEAETHFYYDFVKTIIALVTHGIIIILNGGISFNVGSDGTAFSNGRGLSFFILSLFGSQSKNDCFVMAGFYAQETRANVVEYFGRSYRCAVVLVCFLTLLRLIYEFLYIGPPRK